MNIEIKNEKPIGITLDSKASSPIIKVESHNNVNTQINRQDIELHLQKHPELQILFETKVIGGGGGNSSVVIMTQLDYINLPNKNPQTIYLIVEGDELERLYIGSFLIGRKQQDGSIGFPYIFPIIF